MCKCTYAGWIALLLAACGLVASSDSLRAQDGSGTSAATSQSASGSTAISNNVFSSPSSVATRVTGSTSVRSVPSAIAPGLAAAGIETCLGSVSAAGSFLGGGFSFGSSTKDEDCNRRLYARQLYNMGFKAAAAIIQCLSPEVSYAMAAAGTPCPVPTVARAPAANAAPAGYVVNPAYVEWRRAENARQRQRKPRKRVAHAPRAPARQDIATTIAAGPGQAQ